MARARSAYVCQACGGAHPRWLGRCEHCGEWNTLVEDASVPAGTKKTTRSARGVEFISLAGEVAEPSRLVTTVSEFDRVTGGGLVPGSVTLVAGDPGVGKSTLLLQVAALAANTGVKAAYISGEEAAEQLRLRASRLGLTDAPLMLAATTALSGVLSRLDGADAPAILICDSIQTMHLDDLESAPGSVSQVRSSAQALVTLAKKRGIAVVLVGHVTKDGMLAGPKVLEHLVDTVLYFEGERGDHFRILRAYKNRFGAVDEIGVWEMTAEGLSESGNPSALFLGRRESAVAGTSVFAGLEGSRPLLVEVQALVSTAPFGGTPRRAVVGWEARRLAQLLAVLESRCGLLFSEREVYLNIAGGLRIHEPAADLAVATALISALEGVALPLGAVFFGELSLSGELRAVANVPGRLREARRLGFGEVWMPPHEGAADVACRGFSYIQEVAGAIRDLEAGESAPRRRARVAAGH
ncbi:MAG: DNA repair protein RadA [Alphaproteobacteria bacterium]|nr:DNA repair protein RadA [Alphaproteobacteria bacterium]MDA7983183.1 DNA repair protein RadA [Alphaproteobacteria bacterium]MDA7988798.1 DNA repair protein RadA [Alphaproteobacteria bacterium]MDA8009249.1 DNA repair protein RadA [Alphaproteobacteria bacterium]